MIFQSIPLAAIFSVQCLLVVGAFIAVILVLSEQQRVEFDKGLHERLSLQETVALQDIYAPMSERARVYTTLAKQYVSQLVPANRPTPGINTSVAEALPFYNAVNTFLLSDPSTLAVAVLNRSTIPVPYDPSRMYMNFFVADIFGGTYGRISTGSGGLLFYCVGHPIVLNTATCSAGVVPYDTISTGTNDILADYPAGNTFWATPKVLRDAATGEQNLQISFVYQIAKSAATGGMAQAMYMSLRLSHLKTVLSTAKALSSSHGALFGYWPHVAAAKHYLIMASANISAPVTNNTSTNPSAIAWEGHNTPDDRLNRMFVASRDRCYPSNTPTVPAFNAASPNLLLLSGSGNYAATTVNLCKEAVVFEREGYVVAAKRILTDDYLDLMHLQYTPRSDFYGASDLARMRGIAIGVVGAVIVVGTCVAVLFAIRKPIKDLQSAMDLAASLRNDEVPSYIHSVLSEINGLCVACTGMNEKLLLARPFMPHGILVQAQITDIERSVVAASESERDDDNDSNMVQEIAGGEDSPNNMFTANSSLTHHNAPPNNRSPSNSSQDRQVAGVRRTTAHLSSSNTAITRPVVSVPISEMAVSLKRVAVLAVNVRGFHATVSALQPAEIVDLQFKLCDIVERSATMLRGVIDAFHGDHFILAFNTARPIESPAKSAALTALTLEHLFTEDADLSLRLPLGLSMGLSGGRAHVGTTGTKSLLRLSTIGVPYAEALALQDVMSKNILRRGMVPVAGRCLFTGRVLGEIVGAALFQVAGGIPAHRLAPSAISTNVLGTTQLASQASQDNSAFADVFLKVQDAVIPSGAARPMDSTSNPNVARTLHTIRANAAVIVACLYRPLAKACGHLGSDEWMTLVSLGAEGDPFKYTNFCISQLFLSGCDHFDPNGDFLRSNPTASNDALFFALSQLPSTKDRLDLLIF